MSAGDSDLKFIKEAANQLNGLLTELSGFVSVMEQLLRTTSEGKELLPMMVGTLDRASQLTQKLQTFIYEKEGHDAAALALNSDLYGSSLAAAKPAAPLPSRPGPARIPLGPMRQVIPASASGTGAPAALSTDPFPIPVSATPLEAEPKSGEPLDALATAADFAAQKPVLTPSLAPAAQSTVKPLPENGMPALASALSPGDGAVKSTRSVDPGLMGNDELIMVVDDERNILMLVEMMLKSANYRLLKASSGEEALVLFDEHADEIALTILDFTMEGMNGRDVFLRVIEKQPEARVLMSSGYAEASALKEMLAKGLRGYIPKPYSRDRLLFQVKSVLSNQ